jgi:hypothetical protein
MANKAPDDLLQSRRKISVHAAAKLNDLSEKTFRRYYAHLIRKISPRRDAVALADAIDLPPAPRAPLAKPDAAKRGRPRKVAQPAAASAETP